MYNANIAPEDWVRQIQRRQNDTSKLFGIRYVGSAASGLVTIAGTTCNITLEHGVLASEAADTTVGATGILVMTLFPTLASVLAEINSSPNWEAWAVDVPLDFLTNISTGNGVCLLSAPWDAAYQAKVDAGIFPILDTSLIVIEEADVGITFNGPSNEPHGSDAQVLHEIMKIVATVTYAGGTDGIYIYECDDIAGTKTEVAHLPLVSATATTFGTGDEPLISTEGKRFVVAAKDVSGVLTASDIQVYARSYAFGPAVRKSKLYSSY